jgi:hypothetical protein
VHRCQVDVELVFVVLYYNQQLKCRVRGIKPTNSVADPDHFDTDPDPTFHFDKAVGPDLQKVNYTTWCWGTGVVHIFYHLRSYFIRSSKKYIK